MPGNGIILGRESAPAATIGFDPPPQSSGDLIRHDGEAPITIIAPTGSGKGRDVLIPMLLTHEAPAIVVDMKGELSAVCARRRREMGHRVAIIDPFKKGKVEGDRLNPLDLFGLKGAQVDGDAEMIASYLGNGHEFRNDPFWTDTGGSLIAGLLAYAASAPDVSRSLATVRKLLASDDVDYQLAVLLDTAGKKMSPFAYAEIGAYLQICSDKTRPSVLSTARTFLKALNAESVAACMEDPTVDLQDVVAGKPLDIFLVVPPENAISHAAFLRVMIGTLLTAIMRRTRIPEQRTLMVIDEAAQLGKEFAPLLTATTLMRGYGLQLVSVWQDVAQIKSRYKEDWQTILNNSGTIMTFGIGHHAAAKDAGAFLGLEPHELMKVEPDEAWLAVRNEGVRKVERLNYLTDPMFAGLADPNPYFAPEPDPADEPAAREPETWQEKLASARDAIRKSFEDEADKADEESERLFRAFMHMMEAIEEVGRIAQAPKETRDPTPERGSERE